MKNVSNPQSFTKIHSLVQWKLHSIRLYIQSMQTDIAEAEKIE